MLVLERLRERQATALDNRGVVLLVPKDVVLTTGKTRHYAQVNLKTCAVDHGVFFASIRCKLLLEILVDVERAVEER